METPNSHTNKKVKKVDEVLHLIDKLLRFVKLFNFHIFYSLEGYLLVAAVLGSRILTKITVLTSNLTRLSETHLSLTPMINLTIISGFPQSALEIQIIDTDNSLEFDIKSKKKNEN